MDDAEKLLAGCSIIDSVRNDEAMSMRGRFHHFDLKNSDGAVEGLSNCCTVWLLIFSDVVFRPGGGYLDQVMDEDHLSGPGFRFFDAVRVGVVPPFRVCGAPIGLRLRFAN